MQAMELMNTVSISQYSYNALMGNNLTQKPFKIEFKYLEDINPEYESFDALGWKKKGTLYIYINNKHRNAPPEAIAALLAHEAIHQDEFASLNEETYAWTLEAATWMKLTEKNFLCILLKQDTQETIWNLNAVILEPEGILLKLCPTPLHLH